MVKIDFGEVVKAGKALRPVGLTLFINWAIKPFTMYAIASFFLGTLFLGFIGPDAVDHREDAAGSRILPSAPIVWGRQSGAGRRREDAGSAAVEKLSGRLHSAGHCSVHGDGAGVGITWRKVTMVTRW